MPLNARLAKPKMIRKSIYDGTYDGLILKEFFADIGEWVSTQNFKDFDEYEVYHELWLWMVKGDRLVCSINFALEDSDIVSRVAKIGFETRYYKVGHISNPLISDIIKQFTKAAMNSLRRDTTVVQDFECICVT